MWILLILFVEDLFRAWMGVRARTQNDGRWMELTLNVGYRYPIGTIKRGCLNEIHNSYHPNENNE